MYSSKTRLLNPICLLLNVDSNSLPIIALKPASIFTLVLPISFSAKEIVLSLALPCLYRNTHA